MAENERYTITNSTLRAIFRDVANLRERDARHALPEIIHGKGIDMVRAVEISEKIIAGVDNFDRVMSETTEGHAVIRRKMAAMSPGDRLILAGNIRVIHEAMNNPAFQKALQDGMSIDSLREKMLGDTADMSEDEIDVFVEESLKMVDEIGLTKNGAKQMLAAIRDNREILSTMRSIAAKDYDLKVSAAVEIYFATDESVSVEDAVAMACTSVELQRVADDLDRGIVTAAVAYCIIFTIGIAAAMYMSNFTTNMALSAGVGAASLNKVILSILMLVGAVYCTEELSDHLPLWVGWAAVKVQQIGRPAVNTTDSLDRETAETVEQDAGVSKNAATDLETMENDPFEEQTEDADLDWC